MCWFRKKRQEVVDEPAHEVNDTRGRKRMVDGVEDSGESKDALKAWSAALDTALEAGERLCGPPNPDFEATLKQTLTEETPAQTPELFPEPPPVIPIPKLCVDTALESAVVESSDPCEKTEKVLTSDMLKTASLTIRNAEQCAVRTVAALKEASDIVEELVVLCNETINKIEVS